MHIPSFWSVVTYVTSWLTFSPFEVDSQRPFIIHNHHDLTTGDYLKFPPPGKGPAWAGGDFQCDYSEMEAEGWIPCYEEDRQCWLRHPDGRRFDINTDYEKFAPTGVDRYYEVEIVDGWWNTDGLNSTGMKLVNGTYPGPWIQACWGDRIIVNVTNNLNHNGTAIHWHGIRQNLTMHMDGVPGITQCPIAPKDYFVYDFAAIQYGSSWYHSHYSVQYADGMLGPMTIHGPTTAHYDEAKLPLLMSDWFHNSSFRLIHGQAPGFGTILLNGTGDISKWKGLNDSTEHPYPDPDLEIPKKYQLHFTKPESRAPYTAKRYLMRIINTSFSTTFIFSIDNHRLQIVGADFVPMVPTKPRTHVMVGIGQRYNIIVEADPISYINGSLPSDGNFWIRTTVAKCFKESFIGNDGYDTNGILRYDPESTSEPSTQKWPDIDQKCRDEHDLVPKLAWDIKAPPVNGEGNDYGEKFGAAFQSKEVKNFPLAHWSFEPNATNETFNPLQIDYENPIFLHLDNINQEKFPWEKKWVVISEDYNATSWVYLALAGPGGVSQGYHPIHLHGHDFAVLETSEHPFRADNLSLTLGNPLRRDVILLPNNGYIVIAFKTDNPGSWLMHCHIAYHASEGLALQVLERQADANRLWLHPNNEAILEAERVCTKWKDWYSDCRNYWPGYVKDQGCYPSCPTEPNNTCTVPPKEPHIFMDDSGI